MSANLARLFATDERERACRLRELRMAASLMIGPTHPVTVSLGGAIASLDELPAALAELGALPALPRRRLLAIWASVLPALPR